MAGTEDGRSRPDILKFLFCLHGDRCLPVHQHQFELAAVQGQAPNDPQQKSAISRPQFNQVAQPARRLVALQKSGHATGMPHQNVQPLHIAARTDRAWVAGRQFIEPFRFNSSLHVNGVSVCIQRRADIPVQCH